MKQTEFANHIKATFAEDKSIVGIAVGGSWISNEIDEFSDLDLIIVTREKITDDKTRMLQFAKRAGNLLSGFTGEHVGEPRLLICLYDDPLLHVDYKFVTIDEFKKRIETPVILLDKTGELKRALENSDAKFPYPDYQWIEDRFWIWLHYVLLKIGRGENLEAFDFFSYLRMTVLSPLLHIKNHNLPRGVRKVETDLDEKDLKDLLSTIPEYNTQSLLNSLRNTIKLYQNLRATLFTEKINLQKKTEERVMQYFYKIEGK
nr:aminoglycoside 6-adenylyltransferase [uncultured Draconibacterium sp.]